MLSYFLDLLSYYCSCTKVMLLERSIVSCCHNCRGCWWRSSRGGENKWQGLDVILCTFDIEQWAAADIIFRYILHRIVTPQTVNKQTNKSIIFFLFKGHRHPAHGKHTIIFCFLLSAKQAFHNWVEIKGSPWLFLLSNCQLCPLSTVYYTMFVRIYLRFRDWYPQDIMCGGSS